jgi:hypothetical protein
MVLFIYYLFTRNGENGFNDFFILALMVIMLDWLRVAVTGGDTDKTCQGGVTPRIVIEVCRFMW